MEMLQATTVLVLVIWLASRHSSARYRSSISGTVHVTIPGLRRFWATCEKLPRILHDYWCYRFYKPWGSDRNVIIISDRKHIAQLSDDPALSQRAAYADMFGFRHTMNGLDHHEHDQARYRLLGRALQVNGPERLAEMFPYLKNMMDATISGSEWAAKLEVGSEVSISCSRTIRGFASQAMCFLFFGQDLAEDARFGAALLQYARDLVNSLMFFQVTPGWLATFVHRLVTRNARAMHVVQDTILSTIQSGDSLKSKSDSCASNKHTLLSSILEMTRTSDHWTPETHSQQFLGLWLAASHQPWMNLNFMILELCRRPVWQEILRKEIGNYDELTYHTLENFPLLDSFMKETVRYNPLDHHSIRRTALREVRLANGSLRIPAGSMACVSSFNLMHDHRHYANPESFDGRRFVKELDEKSRRYTEVSERFPVWGFGSLACPGRFYASTAMKVILAHLLCHYDMELKAPAKPVSWMWETFTMPFESTNIVLRKRDQFRSQ